MLSFIDEFCEDCEPEDSFSQISSSFQPRYNSQNWYPSRWVFSYRIGSCTDRCAGRAAVAFWTLQQPSKIKIKQRERSVLENGLKTCPTDEFSPSWEKAYNGVAYKPCVCTLVKNSFRRQILLVLLPFVAEKAINKEAFRIFICKRKSNDRQWPNWKEHSTMGRRVHLDRCFPTFSTILAQTSLRRQLFKVFEHKKWSPL